MSWLAAAQALTGVLGVGQSMINAKAARDTTNATNRANRELAEYAYSKDLEMWNRGNEYNSPTAQMERLKAAGLNPNMVYGSGAVGNTSGSLPSYNAPTMQRNLVPPVDMSPMIAAFQNMAMNQAQVKNIQAQTNKTEAETLNVLASNPGISSDAEFKKWQAHFAPTLMQAQADATTAGTQSVRKDINIKALEEDLKKWEVQLSKTGMSKNDGLQWRVLVQLFDMLGIKNEIEKSPTYQKLLKKME